jgi:hypothetical protein
VNSISTEANTSKRTGATIMDYVIIFAFSFGFVMYFGEPNSEGGKTVSGLPALVPIRLMPFLSITTKILKSLQDSSQRTGLYVPGYSFRSPATAIKFIKLHVVSRYESCGKRCFFVF